jgi:hypothetical protein
VFSLIAPDRPTCILPRVIFRPWLLWLRKAHCRYLTVKTPYSFVGGFRSAGCAAPPKIGRFATTGALGSAGTRTRTIVHSVKLSKKKAPVSGALFLSGRTAKLLRISGWRGSEFAAPNRARSAGRHGWHSCGCAVTLHQHGHHRAFGFLHKCQSPFGSHIDANEIP